MGVIINNGIGYGTAAKAAFYTELPPSVPGTFAGDDITVRNEQTPWVLWDAYGNREPVDIADDIQNTPVLSAGIEASVRLAVGRGLYPALLMDVDSKGDETLEAVMLPEILEWLEVNNSYLHSYRNIYNMLGYGWGATQIILNKDKNYINRIFASDVYTLRLAKKNPTNGFIETAYMSGDWINVLTGTPDFAVNKIPVLREGYELDHLSDTPAADEYIMLHRLLRNGRQYYPIPLHRSAKAWVKVTRAVPEFKNFLKDNQMSLKYLITVSDTYWSRRFPQWDSFSEVDRQAKVQEVYDQLNNWLTGQANAGKTIIAGAVIDPYTKTLTPDIKIEVIDDKMKDGKMLPDSAAADKQILFSMFFNPAIWGGNLLGDGASGGAGSGSDIREATLVLMMLLHPERQNNVALYNLVKRFNKWEDKVIKNRTVMPVSSANDNANTKQNVQPRLVFRYSSSLLTTLDQGGSLQTIKN
jgi:hypothetical protein